MALIILAGFLALATLMSAFGKLKKIPNVMEMMAHVGVKPHQIPQLAAIEIAGALGLVIGIWIPVLGTLAAIGFILYFAGAVLGHVRKGDKGKDLMPAFFLLLIAVVTTLLQLKR